MIFGQCERPILVSHGFLTRNSWCSVGFQEASSHSLVLTVDDGLAVTSTGLSRLEVVSVPCGAVVKVERFANAQIMTEPISRLWGPVSRRLSLTVPLVPAVELCRRQ